MMHAGVRENYRALYHTEEYLDRVCIAEAYAQRILPFIPRGLPVFQSHGPVHSLAIIRYINQLILSFPGRFHIKEIFLLYLAAWFHDIGFLHPLSIHDRGRHPAISAEMIMQDQTLSDLLSLPEQSDLAVIVRFHDTHADLSQIRTQSSLRIPLLAGMFRLTDAIDIGNDRCPPELFTLIEDGLDEHSRRHWKAHQNVIGCSITYPKITITIHTRHSPFFLRRIVPHLEDDCRSCGVVCRQYGIEPPRIVYIADEECMQEILPTMSEAL